MPLTLTLLLTSWATLLFGGFLLGRSDPYRRMPLWTRMLSSAVLVLAGWLWYAQLGSVYTLLVAIGMTLGFVGDAYMAELIRWPRPHVLGGMGSFGLGHVAYIAACLVVAREAGLAWGALLIWLLIGAIGWYVLVLRGAKEGEVSVLHYAALPYALLLSSTAGVSTGLTFNTAAFISFALGAALFLFSDLLIAVDLFNNKRFYLMGDAIWLTYGPAQALIVYTAAWL